MVERWVAPGQLAARVCCNHCIAAAVPAPSELAAFLSRNAVLQVIGMRVDRERARGWLEVMTPQQADKAVQQLNNQVGSHGAMVRVGYRQLV